jgi:gamma-glutamylcysteine synthetase
MNSILSHFTTGFERALAKRASGERRVGAELKFPLVNEDGTSVDKETIDALWQYLVKRGWKAEVDAASGNVVGASKPGERNDTVASCETGFSKTEFSLAHVGDLHALSRSIDELRAELKPFTEDRGAFFLCHGIHQVTPPSKRLMMKKVRASVWDDVYPGNSHVPPEDGQNINLFTVNAASHVHIGTSMDESIPAVNAMCGFAGAQIALTANSSIWKGGVDPSYKCVADKFWNWWIPEGNRVGVPERPFADLADYVAEIASFRPIFAKRDGVPYLLKEYATFADAYAARPMRAVALDGTPVELTPEPADIDVHCTCYWFNARLTRYYTVENRACDEQPADALCSVAALTLGLVEALPEATEALKAHEWSALRDAREAACRNALEGSTGSLHLSDLARELLSLARLGLERRDRGEQVYLDPLDQRLCSALCPADDAEAIFESGGIDALVRRRSL